MIYQNPQINLIYNHNLKVREAPCHKGFESCLSPSAKKIEKDSASLKSGWKVGNMRLTKKRDLAKGNIQNHNSLSKL